MLKTIKLAASERRLIRESIDELLLTVNNHCNSEYASYSPEAYAEELRRRESLKQLKKKFK